ncbi:hypothetical protein B0T25DRAFT_485306 [Lasiosphaeria hispida]|uniref:protein S-acyltransferase n=1 Tax=Lasiosphaeria hispida TaxID=260671 RepID=A0AAJ0MB99_9PEZI|nr:hypothetical protein B0T25DRAFT_485306 [Lasiosphaeria hispida]
MSGTRTTIPISTALSPSEPPSATSQSAAPINLVSETPLLTDTEKGIPQKPLSSVIGGEEWYFWSQTETENHSRIATVFFVIADDIRVLFRLYSAPAALALVLFGRKSIWKTQARVLGSRFKRPRRGGSGDDPGDDPHDSDGSDGVGDPGGDKRVRGGELRERRPRVCRGDPAAEEYTKMVEGESTRIGVSGSIIASVATAALAFGSLSQTHWVARAAWTYSLAAALMAVYCANNLCWKTGYLLLGNRLRAWISGHRHTWYYYLQILNVAAGNGDGRKRQVNALLDSLVPSPASALTVSAPSVLLSSSLLFLFIGFGIFFGFTWERVLDDLAGSDDSRNVFISYIVGLGFCFLFYAASDTTSHDKTASTTIRGTVGRSLQRFDGGDRGGKLHPPGSGPEQDMLERRQHHEVIRQLLERQSNILKHMLDKQDMMELANLEPDFRDSSGQTPLHWAAERGMKFMVLRLLRTVIDISTEDKEGRTPLMVAAANGHVEVVRELLYENRRRVPGRPLNEEDLGVQDKQMRAARDVANNMGLGKIADLIGEEIRTLWELRG